MRAPRALWATAPPPPALIQNAPLLAVLAGMRCSRLSRPLRYVSNTTTETKSSNVAKPFRNVMRHVPHPVVVITTLDYPVLQLNGGGTNPTAITARVPDHWSDADIPHPSISRHQDIPASQLAPIPRAMTASSFTSLTLDPVPTILFNVTLPSRSHSAILSSRTFNVHVLSADQNGARVADLFARGYTGGGNNAAVHDSTSNSDTKNKLDDPSAIAAAAAAEHRRKKLGMLADLEEQHGIEIVAHEQWDLSWHRYSQSWPKEPKFLAPLLQGPGILHVVKCKLVDLQFLGAAAADLGAEPYALVAGQVTEVVSSPRSDVDPASNSADEGHRTALSYVNGAYRGPSRAIMRHNATAISR